VKGKWVEFIVTAYLELDQAVLDRANDSTMPYGAMTERDIFGHISYNMLRSDAELTQLDGWADLSNDMARLTNVDWEGQP
jgi:hypothetical protein